MSNMFEAYRVQAAQIVANWSVVEKVGQLFILAFPGKNAEAARILIEQYNLGGCYLSQDNAETFAEARQLTQAMAAMVQQREHHVPLLLGVDQEGAWSVLTPESTTGPGNLALGAANQTKLTSAMYAVFGEQMRSAGFNCVLGPCSDVNLKPNSPIIDTRAFGEVPTHVAAHVAAAVQGGHQGGITVCAKHFPGHGDTTGDTHREIPVVDKSFEQLMQQDLLPFKAAVDAGVDLVMTSHIRYPQLDAAHPATLSAPILRGVLRETLGFGGIVISDSMNMGAIRRNYAPVDAALLAFKAGIDMMMLSEEHYDHHTAYLDNQLAMLDAIVAEASAGRFPELDSIVSRVVAFKLARLQPMALFQDFNLVAHLEIEKQAAQAAVKILRGPARLLPIQAEQQVVVIQTTPLADYANLMNPRGIGPNQAISAFDYFAAEISLYVDADRLLILDYDAAQLWLLNQASSSTALVLAVTENYPLPGEDFQQAASRELVDTLRRTVPQRLLVVGLRSGYEAMNSDVPYLCAYSSRECSARAAARVCAGEL